MPIRSYKDLIAWQKAIELTTAIYATTQKFPKEEMFGLTSQLRRAAVSVPSNIAEGQARNSSREFGHFLTIALGSLNEAETQLLIAQKLGYLTPETVAILLKDASEVGKIIQGLAASLKN
jgi:four helix bundle protein